MGLVRLSIFVSVYSGALGCLSSLKFIILKDLFWALWTMTSILLLVCPQTDIHNIDMFKKRVVYCFYDIKRHVMSQFSQNTICHQKLMWYLKTKGSSNKTPGYLVQVFCLIFWLLKRKIVFLVICFLEDRKITISVLLTFKGILFARNYWSRFDRSKFIFFLMSLRELVA